MKIAYMMNSYPMTSTTFIREEIQELERQGIEIARFATRPWNVELVDQNDIHEQKLTTYLLVGNTVSLIGVFIQYMLVHFFSFVSIMKMFLKLNKVSNVSLVQQFSYLLQAFSLHKNLKSRGVRHVHSHFGTNATTVCLLASQIGDFTYSFTAHGPDEFETVPSAEYRLKIQNAKNIFAISSFCVSKLILLGGFDSANKIEIIHCGLPINKFELSPIPDNQTFVCVGRLCNQKAQMLILDAVKTVKKTFPSVKVTFVGDGDLRVDMEEYINEYGLQQNVILAGWLGGKEVRKTVASARCFLLPSFAEGLPVSIMEAYALGRPVISTFIAGIPELVDNESGWIIPAGDANQIAKAMINCLESPTDTLEKLAKTGHVRVLQNHDQKKEAGNIRKCFDLLH